MHDRDLLPLHEDPALLAACKELKIEATAGMVTRADIVRIGQWLADRPHLLNAGRRPGTLQGVPSPMTLKG